MEGEKEQKVIIERVVAEPLREAYMSVQDADFPFDVGKEIGLVEGLLAGSFFREFIDRRQFDDVVVVDVHALGRLLLVLSRAIVVALIVVKFVRLGARALRGVGNVVGTLGGSQDARASVEWEENTRQKITPEHDTLRKTSLYLQ